MLVILSQKVDTDSSYMDELFHTYHYPARYKNQLHKGDIFIYYQGDRYEKAHRYYFGVGRVGEILTTDGINYYAQLLDCQRFERNVPIYLPDGGYIEQLGYEDVRKSQLPPWQNSIRPLSQQAFDYILNVAGMQNKPEPTESVDVLNERLRDAIRAYFVGKDKSAILRVESIAAAIARAENMSASEVEPSDAIGQQFRPIECSEDKLASFVQYCREMKMSYSYKAVLIMAAMQKCNDNGALHLNDAVAYFRKYYSERKAQGLCVEKKQCIYLKPDVTDKQIEANLIANPVRVLVDSGYFFFNPETQLFSISPEVWSAMDKKSKTLIVRICGQRLKAYYAI